MRPRRAPSSRPATECRDEYRAQTEVIGWLAATPAAEMTDLEKAALHRDLWTELRNQPAKRPATPWWQRLAYVAAGLLVTVGLVSVLNNGVLDGGPSLAQQRPRRASVRRGADRGGPVRRPGKR